MHFKSVSYTGTAPGPRIVISGAVHGNETCGTKGILRLIDDIESGRLHIVAGTVTFIPVTNPLAYANGTRVGDRNLNRCLFPTEHPADFEDRIANWLCPLLASHDVLLDLHSFSAGDVPFVMMGPEDNDGTVQPFRHEKAERTMAVHLGVTRFVDGWMETYARGVERRLREHGDLKTPQTDLRYGVGTTEFMRASGGYALTLECGQHDDPNAPEVAYRAASNTLALLGISDGPKPVPPAARDVEHLSIHDVIDKTHDEDAFARPWKSFDRLVRGDLIGVRKDGTEVVAQEDGYIVFPDRNARRGEEWFCVARRNTKILELL